MNKMRIANLNRAAIFRLRRTLRNLKIAALFVVLLCFFCFADEKPLPDLKDIVVAGPYCGVYSLYACLDVFSKQPPMEELLTTEYVGSFRGSTAKELIAAAEKFGIHGKCYGNMSWRQLFDAQEPMILHFRGSNDTSFNHWVAFLGAEGKHLRIVDIPHEMAYLSIAELLAHWDGTAIVLSKNPIRKDIVWRAWLDYLPIVLCLLGGVYILRMVASAEPSTAPTRRLMVKRLFVQTIALVGITVSTAILFHTTTETGFLKNPVAVAEVTRRYYTVDVPEISVSEMKQFVERNDILIVDTRYRRDFSRGAIPGAVNLPIDSDLSDRKNVLQGVGKLEKIVLYCQSARCGFSDEIAAFLKFNDYRNVSIFRGGYREWSADNQP